MAALMQQPHEQWAGAPGASMPAPAGQGAGGPSAPVTDPSMTKAGTILLLVGAIVTLVLVVLSFLMAVVMLMMFAWFDHWFHQMPPMFDGTFMPWPTMGGGFFFVMMLLSVLVIAVVAVLHFVAWKMAVGGDYKRAGIWGIIAGSLGLVFASGTGIIGLLGGIFVLMGARETPAGPGGPPSQEPSSSLPRPPQQ